MSELARWWVMFGVQCVGLVFSAIEAFPQLKNGTFVSIGEIVFYVLIGSVIATLGFAIRATLLRRNDGAENRPEPPYPDLRSDLEAYSRELAQSKADTAARSAELGRAQHRIEALATENANQSRALETVSRQLEKTNTDLLEARAALKSVSEELGDRKKKEAEEARKREDLNEKLRSAPKLWVEYKPKDPMLGAESLVFSKDGDQAIVEITPGPLTWDLPVQHAITFLNNVSPVRTQPVECKVSVSEGNISHGGIPDHLRHVMRKYETTVSPTMTLPYQTTDGTWFEQTYSLSIDPYNKLVIKPEGPLRLHN